ncbi:MAG: mechanosensitive ion channel family protein [Bdellovibrio sp.]|nr:mechanosensitive ion channel family protein [Bdellovibrio sp.]
MNASDLNIHAGAQFLSSEMQDLSEKVIFLIPSWKWVVLIAGFVLLGFIKVGLSWLIKRFKFDDKFSKGKTFVQIFVKLEIEKSMGWILTALLARVLIDSLSLTPNLENYLTIFVKVVLAFNLIRIGYLAADAFGNLAQEWASKTDTTIDDQLAPLATKTLKVLVVIFGILMLMQSLKIEVAPFLAGLGIGGVALAFAAQDTVANVFGTITIILDAPFKMGDRIKIGETEGFVEEVGFRSTRIRTFYNSTITLPNSVVAKEKIDNLTDRNGVVRFRQIIGLTYDATMPQIQQFIQTLRSQLKQDLTVDQSRVSISLNSFGESSLNVLVNFHFQMAAGEDENVRTEGYLTLIHHLVTQMRMDFAFPTQTMIVQNKLQPPPPNPGAPQPN